MPVSERYLRSHYWRSAGKSTVFQIGVGEFEHLIGDESTVYRGDPDSARANFAQPMQDALGRAVGIVPVLVSDDVRTAFQANRQRSTHAIVGPGVIVGETRVAAPANLRRRNGRFGRGSKTQIVEVTLVGVERHRRLTITQSR
jgi:hypothetical protein